MAQCVIAAEWLSNSPSFIRRMSRLMASGVAYYTLPLILAVLTILLNTAICILHCHRVSEIFPSTSPAEVGYIGYTLHICHSLDSDGATSIPAPVAPDILQRLYAFAPLIGDLSLVPLLLLSLIETESVCQRALRSNPPDPPPPRLLFHPTIST